MLGVFVLGLLAKTIAYLGFLRPSGLHLRSQVVPFGDVWHVLRVYKIVFDTSKLVAVTPQAHMLCVARHKKGRRSRALGAARFTPRIHRDSIQGAIRADVPRELFNGILRQPNIFPAP